MKCPYCGYLEDRVLDSRPSRDEIAIRRRRECLHCLRRFTTFEQVERPRAIVRKKDGTRDEFSREKLLRSMEVACRKRPVPQEVLAEVAARIEHDLGDRLEGEVTSEVIGERVMQELIEVDQVALVRYASVYLQFDSPREFKELVAKLTKKSTTSGILVGMIADRR